QVEIKVALPARGERDFAAPERALRDDVLQPRARRLRIGDQAVSGAGGGRGCLAHFVFRPFARISALLPNCRRLSHRHAMEQTAKPPEKALRPSFSRRRAASFPLLFRAPRTRVRRAPARAFVLSVSHSRARLPSGSSRAG